MTRMIRNWTPEKVDDFEVAPHRYTWNDGGGDVDGYVKAMPLREFYAKQPYQRGEVVWVERNGAAVKARVREVLVRYDRYNDRKPVYRVQYATAAGLWAKVFVDTYPGPIQRGYKLAGLAPEMPD